MRADSDAAIQFIETAYEPTDWIALLLKSYETGRTAQRVGPRELFVRPTIHAWLRAMNARRYNIYVRQRQRHQATNGISNAERHCGSASCVPRRGPRGTARRRGHRGATGSSAAVLLPALVTEARPHPLARRRLHKRPRRSVAEAPGPGPRHRPSGDASCQTTRLPGC